MDITINQLEGFDYKILMSDDLLSVATNADIEAQLVLKNDDTIPALKSLNLADKISGLLNIPYNPMSYTGVINSVEFEREYVQGYDLYSINMTQTTATRLLDTALQVPDGGTGRSELGYELLKGDGVNPVQNATAGVDYVKPIIPDVDWTPITPNDGFTVSTPLYFSWAIISNVLYVRLNDLRWALPANTQTMQAGVIPLPTGLDIPFQCEATGTYIVDSGGGRVPVRVLMQTGGRVTLNVSQTSSARTGYVGIVAGYPLTKTT